MYLNAWYCAPKLTINEIEIKSVLKTIKYDQPKAYFVLGGNLNAKHEDWFNVVSNINDKHLKKILNDNNYIQHTMLPTHNNPRCIHNTRKFKCYLPTTSCTSLSQMYNCKFIRSSCSRINLLTSKKIMEIFLQHNTRTWPHATDMNKQTG